MISKEKIIIPSYLKKGSKIGIVATARKVFLDELEAGISFMKSAGFEVVFATNIGKENYIFAGTDEERLNGFQTMLDDPEIEAIWCARGGYGTLRIIDKIDWKKFNKKPKWIIGYSDITSILSVVLKNGVAAMHGPMCFHFNSMNDELSQNILLNRLTGAVKKYTYFPTEPLNSLNKNGISKGKLIGGNLSLFHFSIGTNSDLNTENCILFIEDVDEYLYNIDRMIFHLKRSGKLEKLAGLVVGSFTNNKDNEDPFGRTAYQIISEAVSEYNYPVVFEFPAGHQSENWALVLGAEIELTVTDEIVEMEWLEG